ncbi:cupin domain-containing protein [Paracoccus amoyensis]|nr:cupin domain-containing protein [Paracoccus amoyensis]
MTAAITAASPAIAQSGLQEQERLESLIANGAMAVDPKIQMPLREDLMLSLAQVEIAPGITEPRHTHPGIEILYGIGGTGYVQTDGPPELIEPGRVVRIPAGTAKALTNPSETEPLVVLAVLALDPKRPLLTVEGQHDEDWPAQQDVTAGSGADPAQSLKP